MNLSIFLENPKNYLWLWGKTRKKPIASFIMIRRMEVGLKSREPIVEEKEVQEPTHRIIFGHVQPELTFFQEQISTFCRE